jgi:hypothetical protein
VSNAAVALWRPGIRFHCGFHTRLSVGLVSVSGTHANYVLNFQVASKAVQEHLFTIQR